jgi:hypothetical protein
MIIIITIIIIIIIIYSLNDSAARGTVTETPQTWREVNRMRCMLSKT